MDLDLTQDWTCALPHTERGKWTQSDRVEKLFKVWVFRLAVHLYSDGGDDWTVVYFHFCLLFMLTLASPHVSRSLFPLCMCVRSTLWGIFIHQMTSVSFPHWGKQALKCMSFSYASLNSCKCLCVWQRYKLYLCLYQEKGTAESKEDGSG